MNIKNIIDHLMQTNPYNQFILTNCISAEIAKDTLCLNMPDSPIIKKIFNSTSSLLRAEVLKLFRLNIDCTYSDFKMPLLPYPAQNSKHGNILFFLFPGNAGLSSRIIKKRVLFDHYQAGEKLTFLKSDDLDSLNSPCELFFYIEKIFLEIFPLLKEKWTYLHPILPFIDNETLFMQKLLIENVLNKIGTGRIAPDIRRFVGTPCFTPMDYKATLL